MPPIQLHLDDPITPKKSTDGAANPNTTPSAPPPAQPGAAAFPAPTPFAAAPRPPPTRTTAQETATFSQDSRAPPPPQPGAVPLPPTQAQDHANPSLPPPPKAGGSLSSHTAPITAPPSQFSIPPPQQNYAPTHSTSTTTTAQIPGGPTQTTLNLGPVQPQLHQTSVQHPSGYQQNLFAQEMTSAQRASMDQQQPSSSGEGVLSQVSNAFAGRASGEFGSAGGAGGFGGGGVGGGGIGGMGAGGGDGNMWSAVKGWASKAGQSLAETEESVWKKINGQ